MRRIDLYVVRECLGPLGLGFLVYTSILLLQFIYRSAEMIVRRDLPWSVVGELLVYTLPNIVVLTLPMSFLFGVLIAFGRLSADSELTAMRAAGVSLLSLYRPILVVSLLLTGLNTYLMLVALPAGNKALQDLRMRIVTQTAAGHVEPRIFFEEWPGKVLYVFEVPPRDSTWRGVFFADSLPGTANEVTIAAQGRMDLRDGGRRVVLELGDAVTHRVDLSQPDRYEVIRHRQLQRLVDQRLVDPDQLAVAFSRGPRELSLGELQQRLRDPETPASQANILRVEVHKKFSIPFACFVFGLFAVPLGAVTRRAGKSSGFALSILVILFYYVLINHGEEAARVGSMAPWLAMWLPNLALSGLGAYLLLRKNRDQGLLPGGLDRWLRSHLGTPAQGLRRLVRRRAPGVPAGSAGERIRRALAPTVGGLLDLRLPFPTLLDRYIIRTFAWVFTLVLVSGLLLHVIADLSENLEEMLEHGVGLEVIVEYYFMSSFKFAYEILPLAVLVTTLTTFSLLSRTQETTAARALGTSLYRLALPALFCAALLSGGSAFLQSEVLPTTNQRVAQLKDQIRGREAPRTYRRADRQWVAGRGPYLFNYLHYDDRTQTLQRPQIFHFDEERRLRERWVAQLARYRDGAWELMDGWRRSFDGIEVTRFERFEGPLRVDFPEAPDYFESEVRQPEQMRFGELRAQVEELRAAGQAVLELEVELQKKLAFPLASFVMALVGLPFAFRIGRSGALYGLGLAIVLGIVFLAIYAFFITLGEVGVLPAAAAVWSPHLMFALLSVYMFLGVRS